MPIAVSRKRRSITTDLLPLLAPSAMSIMPRRKSAIHHHPLPYRFPDFFPFTTIPTTMITSQTTRTTAFNSFNSTFLFPSLLIILLLLLSSLPLGPFFRVSCLEQQQFRPSRYGAPRFKQNARTDQFAYLGDTIRFKCNAIGRPQPKVHWYRNGHYLNYTYLVAHPRLKEKAMLLELRRIEVGDRGNWTCRVWNNEGSATRNFTLHIVDFCDYFLNVHIHPRRVPEECLCQWAIQQRDLLTAATASDTLYQLRAMPQLRADLDLSEFLQNTANRCQQYAGVEEIAKLRAQQQQQQSQAPLPPSSKTFGAEAESANVLVEEEEEEEEEEKDASPIHLPQKHTHPTHHHHRHSHLQHHLISTTKMSTTQPSPPTKLPSSAVPSVGGGGDGTTFAVSSTRKWRPTIRSKWFLPRLDPVKLLDLLAEQGVPDISHLMPELLPASAITFLRRKLPNAWQMPNGTTTNLELSARIELARKMLHHIKQREEDGDGDSKDTKAIDDQEEEEKVRFIQKTQPTTTTSSTTRPWTIRSTRPPSWLTTKRWSLPQRVPPYFRQLEENVQTNIVMPAGRTLKLSCKAGGQPVPQVVWRKGNDEILRDSESKTGSLYQLRKWSLELEDAAEVDSGDYACEVFNSAGSIVRRFHVEIQDRIRSRPILVPNVLHNKTVDVNGTVNFTCQVISDLVPHVVWIKLIQRNGSYLRWDRKEQRQALNFLDLSTLRRARIFHDKQTNRYTMVLSNVTMEDQGIYSCVVGNTLGLSMANATLTVNEFRSLTLPTEVLSSWPFSYTVLLILSFLLLCAFVALGMLYMFFAKKFSSKNRVQTLDKMAVRKKVVITKKPQREGEFWSDLASSYSITVEPVPVIVPGGRGGAGGGGRDLRSRTETGDTVPLMGFGGAGGGGEGPSDAYQNAESSLLSDYEVPTDMAWEIERDRLQLLDLLGEGAFGEVWRGMLRPKSGDGSNKAMPVAVKRLKTAAQERELIILVSEMQILKSIGQHPNVLSLIGCCTGLGPLLVVLELCEYGNLRDFLRRHRPREQQSAEEFDEEEEEDESETDDEEELEEAMEAAEEQKEGKDGSGRRRQRKRRKRWRQQMYQNVESATGLGADVWPPDRQLTLHDLVHFAMEIARGMEFLASKKIIHRDLAARNVLVAKDLSMKISDFGLSRNVFFHDYYRKRGAGRLPIKWMAPEALEANVYTVNSDVWSYGILLWEIMTLGGTPYPSIAMPQLYNLLKEGYRMEAPHNCPDEIYGVMVSCWQEVPDARPAFRLIADYFDWMLTEADNRTTSSETTENGETTDEGPYAVIPEGQAELQQQQQQQQRGRLEHQQQQEGVGTSGGGGGIMATDEGGAERGLLKRPMSAPGLMSFELFSREIAGPKGEEQKQQQKPKISGSDSANLPLPMEMSSTAPRRSLLMQLRDVFIRAGGSGGGRKQPAKQNDTTATVVGDDAEAGTMRNVPIYRNFPAVKQAMRLLQQQPKQFNSNFYANSPHDEEQQQQPGTSSASDFDKLPGQQQQQHPMVEHGNTTNRPRPKKKSIASDQGLRVALASTLFTGIAQQNAKLSGGMSRIRHDRLDEGGTPLGSAGSSAASFGRSPPGSGTLLLHTTTNKSTTGPGADGKNSSWGRSRSMESTSSGHGGSSAMSSADALGGTLEKRNAGQVQQQQLEKQDSPPVGTTVEYVCIGPLGKFPAASNL